MINQILRFLFIFISLFFLGTLTAFLYSNNGMLSYFIMNNPSDSDLFILLNYYFIYISNFLITAVFVSLFLSVLFFLNSRQLKLGLSYKKGFIISFVFLLLLSLSFIFFVPQKNWQGDKRLLIKDIPKLLTKLYKSGNILNINGKTIYYADYDEKNKRFKNILISTSEDHQFDAIDKNGKKNKSDENKKRSDSMSENEIFFAYSGKINQKTSKLDIKEAFLVNPKNEQRKIENISLDLKNLYNRIYFENKSLSHNKKLSKITYSFFSLFPVQGIHTFTYTKASLILDIIYGKKEIGKNISKIISIIIEWTAIFLIVSSLAVLISNTTVPFINFATSIIISLGLIFLAFNYLDKMRDILSFIPGLADFSTAIILLLCAIILQIFAVIKYRKQGIIQNNGQEG